MHMKIIISCIKYGGIAAIVIGTVFLISGLLLKNYSEKMVDECQEELESLNENVIENPQKTDFYKEDIKELEEKAERAREYYYWSNVSVSAGIGTIVIGIILLVMERGIKRKHTYGEYDGEDDDDNGNDSLYGIVRCYECGKTIPILSRRRPLEVECLSCGFKGVIDKIAGKETYTKTNPAPLCSPIKDGDQNTSNEKDDWVVYEDREN